MSALCVCVCVWAQPHLAQLYSMSLCSQISTYLVCVVSVFVCVCACVCLGCIFLYVCVLKPVHYRY